MNSHHVWNNSSWRKLHVLVISLAALFVAVPAAWSQTAAKIMPLGDSITRGTNDTNYPNGYIPGGYRKNLQTLLTAAGFSYDFVGSKNDNAAAGMDPDHNGTNGIRTDQVLANLSGWLAVQPDTVVNRGETKMVFAVQADQTVKAVPVVTGAPLGNLISLRQGPPAGTKVVRSPPASLQDGMRIKEKQQ